MKQKFDEVAQLLWNAKNILSDIQPNLTRENDKKIIKKLITDLSWANENCTVMELHQINKALDDIMEIETPRLPTNL